MAERRGGACLTLEALDHAFSHEQQGGCQHLDCDFAVERQVVGEVDSGHATAADCGEDLVLTQRRSPQRRELRLGCVGTRFNDAPGWRGERGSRPRPLHRNPRAAAWTKGRPGAEARAAAQTGGAWVGSHSNHGRYSNPDPSCSKNAFFMRSMVARDGLGCLPLPIPIRASRRATMPVSQRAPPCRESRPEHFHSNARNSTAA